MFGAKELVLQLGHLLLPRIDRRSQIAPNPLIQIVALDFWLPLQLGRQPLTQIGDVDPQLFQQRPRHSFALVEQRDDEMLVRNFLVPELRGDCLRRLQCLLHLLRKFIRPHVSRYCSLPGRQPDLSLVGNEARYFRQDEMRILMDQAGANIEELSGREFQRAQT